MHLTLPSLHVPLFVAGMVAAAASSSDAQIITLYSQNFDTDPVNYTATPFVQQGTVPGTGSKYWELSHNVTAIINPNVTGNLTNYLTGQNMDAPLPFHPLVPATVDFAVVRPSAFMPFVTLSIDLAGLSSPEPGDYVRLIFDSDNDGLFDTWVFDFQGEDGLHPYTDMTSGLQLTPAFSTFQFLLFPATAAGILPLRLEVFNDADSENEAVGIDNILIQEIIPEPSTILLLLTGLLSLRGLVRRRAA